MGADSLQQAVVAAGFVEVSLSERQKEQLRRYHDWLATEAIAAGGVGPHERERLWNRHIADSILFGIGLANASNCLDVGSGVGLPGIPLAIAFPSIEFVLLDRSGRRCDLLRRAIAILGIGNCAVTQGDVTQVADQFESIVSRAAIPPEQMMIHVKRLLAPGGVAILGLSRSGDDRFGPLESNEPAISVESIPAEILDSPVYLLRIEAT